MNESTWVTVNQQGQTPPARHKAALMNESTTPRPTAFARLARCRNFLTDLTLFATSTTNILKIK
jgi:hypothetical protein